MDRDRERCQDEGTTGTKIVPTFQLLRSLVWAKRYYSNDLNPDTPTGGCSTFRPKYQRPESVFHNYM